MKIKKSQLTRELLESYAGKKVKIVFFDNDICEGTLVLGMGNRLFQRDGMARAGGDGRAVLQEREQGRRKRHHPDQAVRGPGRAEADGRGRDRRRGGIPHAEKRRRGKPCSCIRTEK